MTRLPYIPQTDFDADQQLMFDHITGGERGRTRPQSEFLNEAGGLSGPFHPWVYAPRLGDQCQALGAAVRFKTELPATLRELAILVVAARWRARYEWWAHEKIARDAGLADTIIDALKARDEPEFGDDDKARALYAFCCDLLDNHHPSDTTYKAAIDAVGTQGVVEAVATMGYYTMVSMTLNAFDVPIPSGEPEPFAPTEGSVP